MLQASLQTIKKKLFFYSQDRLVWATRTALASMISLWTGYYFPQQGFWFVSSSFIMIQLFSFAQASIPRLRMLVFGIGLAVLATGSSCLAPWPVFSALGIALAISTAFFFFYKGVMVSMMATWSMVMVVLNICLPQPEGLLIPHGLANVAGILLAYATTFIRLPRRQGDRPIRRMRSLFKLTQRDIRQVLRNKQASRYTASLRVKLLTERETVPSDFSTPYLNIVYLLAGVCRHVSSDPASLSLRFLEEKIDQELRLLKAALL